MDEFTRYVVPKQDVLVRDIRTMNFVPEVGQYVDWSGKHGTYWKRRVACGDVIISEPPVKDAPSKVKTVSNKGAQ